jgi:DNA-binding Xre family transcriptional regulator
MSRVFVFDSIRAHLKARGMTYRDLASALELSESSVKRIISSNDCTLERLEEICRCLQLDLSDLLNSAPRQRKLLNQLTWKQEEELTKNKELLVLAVCVMKAIARLGDQVNCPKKGHGVNAIVEGDASMLINGIPVALEGHKTACGCSLQGTSAAEHG